MLDDLAPLPWWKAADGPQWPELADLPELKPTLLPGSGRIEHLPRALKVDGSSLPYKPKSKKQQEGPGNPTYDEDRQIWLIGLDPIERALTRVASWVGNDKVSDEFSEVLLALLEMRAAREAGETPWR